MPFPVFMVIALTAALCQGICAATGFQAPAFDRYDVGMFATALLLRHPIVRQRYSLFLPVVTAFQTIVLVCFIGSPIAATLPYAVQAFGNQYQDTAFEAFDRALGFNYPVFISWITNYHDLYEVLGFFYRQFARVALINLLIGMLTYRDRQIGARFLTSFHLSIVLSSIISGLFRLRAL